MATCYRRYRGKHAVPSSPSISLKMRMSQANIVERNSSWYELYRNASSFPFPPLNILSSTILMLTYFQWIVDADFSVYTRTILRFFKCSQWRYKKHLQLNEFYYTNIFNYSYAIIFSSIFALPTVK